VPFLVFSDLDYSAVAASVAGASSVVAVESDSVAVESTSVGVSSITVESMAVESEGVVSVALLPQAANVKAAQAAKAKVIFFIFLLVNLIECAAKIIRKTYTAKHYLFFFKKS
jgi:hypothetical protein